MLFKFLIKIFKDQLDAYLFDITLLLAIQNEDGIPQLPAGYRARPLHSKDIDMNYFALLEQEEDSFHLDKKAFTEKWFLRFLVVFCKLH